MGALWDTRRFHTAFGDVVPRVLKWQGAALQCLAVESLPKASAPIGRPGQAGTTAIASISRRNSGRARALTTAAVMTGALGRSPQTRWNAA
jgi:hypothetical protein